MPDVQRCFCNSLHGDIGLQRDRGQCSGGGQHCKPSLITMRRISNLAFNQEFPEASGLSGIPADNQVRVARDSANPYDPNAV